MLLSLRSMTRRIKYNSNHFVRIHMYVILHWQLQCCVVWSEQKYSNAKSLMTDDRKSNGNPVIFAAVEVYWHDLCINMSPIAVQQIMRMPTKCLAIVTCAIGSKYNTHPSVDRFLGIPDYAEFDSRVLANNLWGSAYHIPGSTEALN